MKKKQPQPSSQKPKTSASRKLPHVLTEEQLKEVVGGSQPRPTLGDGSVHF
jgi:hypothetical protein